MRHDAKARLSFSRRSEEGSLDRGRKCNACLRCVLDRKRDLYHANYTRARCTHPWPRPARFVVLLLTFLLLYHIARPSLYERIEKIEIDQRWPVQISRLDRYSDSHRLTKASSLENPSFRNLILKYASVSFWNCACDLLGIGFNHIEKKV